MAKEEKKEPEMTKSIYRYPSREAYIQAINKAPKKEWIKKRDLGKNKAPSKYVPIEIKEAISEGIFIEQSIRITNMYLVANEIVMCVEIQALPSYEGADYVKFSGVAAEAVQQMKGSTPDKFPLGKITNACEYNAPTVLSSAKSNAYNNYANLFGRQLNRKDVPDDFSL